MKPVWLWLLIILSRIFHDIPLLWLFVFLHFQGKGSGGAADGLFNALLFLCFGLLHSVGARRFARQVLATWVGDAYVRTLYVIISGSTLALVLYSWRPLAGVVWETDGIAYGALTAIYLASIAGMIYTARFIDYPAFLGIRTLLRMMKGEPAKPPAFSARGPYAYCRHPLYLFLFLALWVGPVMTVARGEFALLASLYLLIGTVLEERNLREELGEVYDLYRAHVPMWVPRLRPWRLESSFGAH